MGEESGTSEEIPLPMAMQNLWPNSPARTAQLQDPVALHRTPEKINDPFTEPEHFSDNGIEEPAIFAARWKRGEGGKMRPGTSSKEDIQRVEDSRDPESTAEPSKGLKTAQTEAEWLSNIDEASFRAKVYLVGKKSIPGASSTPVTVHSMTVLEKPVEERRFTQEEKGKWREEGPIPGSSKLTEPSSMSEEEKHVHFRGEFPERAQETTPVTRSELSTEEMATLQTLLTKISSLNIGTESVTAEKMENGLPRSRSRSQSLSNIPSSAYLNQRLSLGVPDDDGGSSSSSDSSGGDSEGEDRKNIRGTTPLPSQREETPESKSTRKRVQKLKFPEPFVYDGFPNYDRFEQWCYAVDTWLDLANVDQHYALKYIATYLSGRAATFYMMHVATAERKYSMERFYRDLFEYCFPLNFKRKLRDRFFAMTQGNRPVRDFLRELERLGKRLADVTNKDIAQRFWKGLHGYIRVELAKKGKDSENTSLKKLASRAIQYENAENLRLDELREVQTSSRTSWSSSSGGLNGKYNSRGFNNSRTWVPPTLPVAKPSILANTTPTMHKLGPVSMIQQNSRGSNLGYRGRSGGAVNQGPNRRARLSKSEQDELRAKNKCFECKEIGHLARDCPKLRKAIPSQIQSAAVNITKTEILGKRNLEVLRCSGIGLGSMFVGAVSRGKGKLN